MFCISIYLLACVCHFFARSWFGHIPMSHPSHTLYTAMQSRRWVVFKCMCPHCRIEVLRISAHIQEGLGTSRTMEFTTRTWWSALFMTYLWYILYIYIYIYIYTDAYSLLLLYMTYRGIYMYYIYIIHIYNIYIYIIVYIQYYIYVYIYIYIFVYIYYIYKYIYIYIYMYMNIHMYI